MDNRPIGIFDSGLGGLTAVKEILSILHKKTSYTLEIPDVCLMVHEAKKL